MTEFNAETEESTDTIDDRDVRALTECASVLEDVGRAAGAEDLYLVISESGSEYLVDAREGACECPDAEYRTPDNGCKHVRRVRFATGETPLPEWADTDAVDDQLGTHVDGEARVAMADGGSVLADFGAGEPTTDAPKRPAECDCIPDADLPCFACYRAGFEAAVAKSKVTE